MKVPIEVFCIGQTTVNPDEVKRWLDFVGVSDPCSVLDDAEQQLVSNPALLIALAGKRCYKSFEPGLNPNVTKIRERYADYFDNILKSGHGSVLEHSVYNFAIENVSRVFCYHPRTEILTEFGWKSVSDVKCGERVLTLDSVTQAARWSINHQTHSFEYAGPMHYWENREDRSPMVTPDHTLWCCPVDLRCVRGKTAAGAVQGHGRKVPFSEMLGKRFFVQNRIGSIEGCSDPRTIFVGQYEYCAEDLMEWMGWVATDGTIAHPETGRSRVRVNQSKPQCVRRLRELGGSLFGDRLRETGEEYKAFDVSCPDLYEWVVNLIGRTKDARDLTPMYGYSARLVGAFLKGAYGGDGCHGSFGHREVACGGNATLAGQYQVLIGIVGRASRVSVRTDQIGKGHLLPSGQTITSTLPATYTSEHQRGEGYCVVKSQHQHVLHYAGMVYCPRTDDGIVYVRDGGKAVWCGNTAEMNRHRAGWAISEGSLRFIRFGENIPYWEPDSIQGPDVLSDVVENEVKEVHHSVVAERIAKGHIVLYTVDSKKHMTRLVLAEAFKDQQDSYRLLEQVWADELKPESKFAQKKQITSMMRRIIGLGVATGGVWSGNIRALRHVITMRASPEAEEEMVHVFTKIAKVVRDREPLLFGDFEQVGDYWVPKYRKV